MSETIQMPNGRTLRRCLFNCCEKHEEWTSNPNGICDVCLRIIKYYGIEFLLSRVKSSKEVIN